MRNGALLFLGHYGIITTGIICVFYIFAEDKLGNYCRICQ